MKKLFASLAIITLSAISAHSHGMTIEEFDREVTGRLVDGGISPEVARRIAIVSMARDMLALNERVCSDESADVAEVVKVAAEATKYQNENGGKFSSAAIKILERKYPCK